MYFFFPSAFFIESVTKLLRRTDCEAYPCIITLRFVSSLGAGIAQSLEQWAMSYGLESSGFIPERGKMFLFLTGSEQFLGPN
jgi:hypothetical protein